jgi:enamine deaminase RidA (YjgF/YER057c/UK114 family)
MHNALRRPTVPFVVLCGVVLGVFAASMVSAQEAVQLVDPRDAEGISAAVIVPDVPLLHTTQMLPVDEQGRLVGKGNARTQIEAVLDRVIAAIRPDPADPEPEIVKLNVVAANDEVVGEVRQRLAHRFKNRRLKPAISFVVGKVRHPDALVTIDAIAAGGPHDIDSRSRWVPRLGGPKTFAHVATLHPGPKIYISGQAEKGKDLAEMTRRTMEGLAATLKRLGLGLDDVLQVKSFIGPITAVADAEREIAVFFKDQPFVPPLAFVEWTTAPSVEIEIVAAGKPGDLAGDDTVEFVTPPGMAASPVFSRVARIAAGPTIYISGLYGSSNANGEAETLEIFDQLGQLLEKSGSDFKHLVKATYYVSTDEASTKLNQLRPRFYDPQRPPAASKAAVTGTGRSGKTITLDMIAVPRPSTK